MLGVVALAVAFQLRHALGACAEHGFQRFFPSSLRTVLAAGLRAAAAPVLTSFRAPDGEVA